MIQVNFTPTYMSSESLFDTDPIHPTKIAMPHQTPAQYGLPICLAIIVTIPILFAIMALLVSLAQKYGSRITTVFRICLTVVLVHLAQGVSRLAQALAVVLVHPQSQS